MGVSVYQMEEHFPANDLIWTGQTFPQNDEAIADEGSSERPS